MWKADTGSWTYQRAADTSSLTWTGTIVGSGHVEVWGTVNGHAFPLPAQSNMISVQPRTWGQATKTVTIVSPNDLPPQPPDTHGALGAARTQLPLVFPPPIGTVGDGGPNEGYQYWTAVPIRVTHDLSINGTMDTLQPFYMLQYTDPGRRGTGQLKNIWWCGRGSVFPLRDIIRHHEGTQSEATSHVGWTDRAADSLLPLPEAVGDPFGGTPNLLDSIRLRVHVVDTLFDYSNDNPYKIDGELTRQVLLPNNYKCRFRYWQ